MNKLVKGSIAGAAGIALLLGGAGTFATWNDNATVAAGTITSGELSLSTPVGAWTDVTDAATPVAVATISNFRTVPGDVLQYAASFNITATGDNLEAELESNLAGLTNGIAGVTPVTVMTVGGAPYVQGNTIPVPKGSTVVSVVITVTFDPNTTGSGSTSEVLDLGALTFTVSQV
ncbi:alternate-type signal peptide domain-containing protein [Salinibacterium sp. ZJ454]|uniref:alternate-type signal peptide domain-containing protein n=1 Tax=Salinibacterium sp. ZJ454 TaxID=2708339 RepID=UPI00141DB24A|nr:alternate-type signal peptide domain-containing protein [Salinibacterium sp. ZJ454]